jgi:hypothetical protein
MSTPDCFRDISAIEKRASDLQEWLQKNAPASLADQKHLDEGTQERVYWHYGYMVALRDVLRFLTDSHEPNQKSYSSDNSSSHPLA